MFNVFFYFHFSFDTVLSKKKNKNFNYFIIFIVFFSFLKKTIKESKDLFLKIKIKKSLSSDFVLLKAPFTDKKVKHILKKKKHILVLEFSCNKNTKIIKEFAFLKPHLFFFRKEIKCFLCFFLLPGFHLFKLRYFFFFNLKYLFTNNLCFKNQLLKKRYLFFSNWFLKHKLLVNKYYKKSNSHCCEHKCFY